MSQTRQVHQVKLSQAELVVMFRAKALEALTEAGTPLAEIEALANAPTNWRGTIDGGIAILLDPVWPEA